MCSTFKQIISAFEKFPVLNISISLSLGILLLTLTGSMVLYGVCVSILTIYLGYKYLSKDRGYLLRTTLILVLGLAIALLRMEILEFKLTPLDNLRQLDGLDVELTGVVNSQPELFVNVKSIVIRPQTIYYDNISAHFGSTSYYVLLTNTSPAFTANYGDLLGIRGKLTQPQNFNGFNYKEFLEAQGIYFVLDAGYTSPIVVQNGNSLLSKLFSFKLSIGKRIQGLLPDPHASLLMGIVYGQTNIMSKEFEDQFRSCGIMHIIAVSGYNITLLVSSIISATKLFGRKLSLYLAIFFIIVFVLFVGVENVPVVRAGIIGVVYCVSSLFGKKKSLLIVLPLVFAIFLLINPLVYRLISFQLSFFSTLGIVLLTDKLKWDLRFLPGIIQENLSSTLAAISFTLPVTLINFQELSLVAPLANILVLPVVSVVTIGGLILLILAVIFPMFAGVIAYLLWPLLEYMILAVRLLSGSPLAGVGLSRAISRMIACLLIFVLTLYLLHNGTDRADTEKHRS